MISAFITGVAGVALTPWEQGFIAETKPAGLILFTRNCESPDQVRALVDQFRAARGGDDCLVLIDQEGGRVQRMRTPAWRELPPAINLAALYRDDAELALTLARDLARLIAMELRGHGIDTNCVPVLDVPVAGAHDIIGSRALGSDTGTIVALGRAIAEGHLDQGVLPVIKHVPGHGRARADSHVDLPVVSVSHAVLAAQDFVPFKALADLPVAMTAHIVYEVLDPDLPATLSRRVIDDIVRGEIGFDGLLLSDDISMQALSGPIAERTRDALEAGCDVALHCNGKQEEMIEVAAGACPLDAAALVRFNRALALRRPATGDARDVVALGEAAVERLMSATV